MPKTSTLRRGYVVSTVFPPEQAQLLYDAAKRNGHSVSEELRQAAAPYFARLEAERVARYGGRPHIGAVS